VQFIGITKNGPLQVCLQSHPLPLAEKLELATASAVCSNAISNTHSGHAKG